MLEKKLATIERSPEVASEPPPARAVMSSPAAPIASKIYDTSSQGVDSTRTRCWQIEPAQVESAVSYINLNSEQSYFVSALESFHC